MIARLTGTIISKEPPTIVLEVNGVAYELDIPMPTLFALPEGDQQVSLHTHLLVREDAQQLYGFIDRQNRDIFRQLLKVNGVGARTALAILSTLAANELLSCVMQNNLDQLVKVPGIGKKTAERIMLDLKDRLKAWQGNLNITATNSAHTAHNDAVSALMALGYKSADAEKAVKQIAKPDTSNQELIRLALQSMA